MEDSSRAQSVRNPPRSRKFIAGASVLFVISTLINAHLNGHLNTIFLKAILSEVLNLDIKLYISGYKSHTSVSGSKS